MSRTRSLWRIGLTIVAALTIITGARGAELDEIAARLQVLEDREAIREVLLAYGRALDRRDFEAFADLFAERRGEWVGGFGSARGRDAIFELMDKNIGHIPGGLPGRSFHVFSNETIDVDGDRATAVTKWIFVAPDDENTPQWMFLGRYDDTFVRENGEWKFLRREAFTDIPIQ